MKILILVFTLMALALSCLNSCTVEPGVLVDNDSTSVVVD